MAGRSVDEATIIEAAVTKAMADARVKDGSPIHQHLVRDCEVYDLTEVCTPSSIDGRSVSLEQRLVEMQSDPRWSRDFSVAERKPVGGRPAPTPAGSILQLDRSQFDAVAKGTARIE